MTDQDNQINSEIDTIFRLSFTEYGQEIYWGPYLTVAQALEASELAIFFHDCGDSKFKTIIVSEWLIREHGLQFIRNTNILRLG